MDELGSTTLRLESTTGMSSLLLNTSNNESMGFNCRTSIQSKVEVTSAAVWMLFEPLQGSSPYVAAVEATFFLIAFTWNLFILGCYTIKPRLLKEPANIYIFNLALVDFLLSITVILPTFLAEALNEFIFGSNDFTRCHICEFFGFMLMFLVTITLHNLAALSVDRLILLAQPLRYNRYLNWKKALLSVCFIWFVSFWLTIPPVLGFGQYEFNTVFANCHPRWTGETNGIKHIAFVIFLAVEALIPITILVITNLWTCKIVMTFIRTRFKRRSVHLKTSKHFKQLFKEEKHAQLAKQKQLVRVFVVLFVANGVCWLPTLLVVVIANIVGPTNIPLGVYVVGWLTYIANPVIHPIVESLFIKDLRYQFNSAQTKMTNSAKKAYTRINRPNSIRTTDGISMLQRTRSVGVLPLQKPKSDTNEPQPIKRAASWSGYIHCDSNDRHSVWTMEGVDFCNSNLESENNHRPSLKVTNPLAIIVSQLENGDAFEVDQCEQRNVPSSSSMNQTRELKVVINTSVHESASNALNHRDDMYSNNSENKTILNKNLEDDKPFNNTYEYHRLSSSVP